MGALIPLLIQLAPGVISLVENLFKPKGSGQGQNKFETAFATIMQLLQAQGNPADIKNINDDAVKAILETFVQLMNAQGLLPKNAPSVPVSPSVVPAAGSVTVGSFKFTIEAVK